MPNELYIMVDLETDGPAPGDYSILSIGLVEVYDLSRTFYTELRPISDCFDPEALAVSGLDRDRLLREGAKPAEAIGAIASWVANLSCERGYKPIFVANNAPFDWSFYNWYAWHFTGHNPFGHTALDMKAYYAGKFGKIWREAKPKRDPRFGFELAHNALGDAIEQATPFRMMLEA